MGCDVEQCAFRTKTKASLMMHRMQFHNVGVTKVCCDIMGCDYKGNRGINVLEHKNASHGFGYGLSGVGSEEAERGFAKVSPCAWWKG